MPVPHSHLRHQPASLLAAPVPQTSRQHRPQSHPIAAGLPAGLGIGCAARGPLRHASGVICKIMRFSVSRVASCRDLPYRAI